MEWTIPVIICVTISTIIAYLLGSANFAIIVSRAIAHDDIRNHGSGNAGLTNVLRTLGKGPAVLTLLGDFSKGITSVIIVRLLLHFCAGIDGFYIGDYIVAFAALVGHVYPVYYGFKGGKGILVSFGALMILSPLAGLLCFSGFLIAVIFTRYVSLGSIIAGILYPLTTMLITALQLGAIDWIEVLCTLPISILIIYMHRANIKRLVKHEENKISFKSKNK